MKVSGHVCMFGASILQRSTIFLLELFCHFLVKKKFNLLLFSDKHITDEFKLQPGASINLLYLVIIATMTEVLW